MEANCKTIKSVVTKQWDKALMSGNKEAMELLNDIIIEVDDFVAELLDLLNRKRSFGIGNYVRKGSHSSYLIRDILGET